MGDHPLPRRRSRVPALAPVLLVAVLCSAAVAAAEKFVGFVGSGECVDCDTKNIKHADAFQGLHVVVNCKVGEGDYQIRGSGKLGKDGKFTVQLPDDLVKETGELGTECYAQLHGGAKNAPCPAVDGRPNAAKLVIESSDGAKHTLGTAGRKLPFSSETCASAFFWSHPWFKHKYYYYPPKVYTPPVYTPPAYTPPVSSPPPTPVYSPPPAYTPPVYSPPPTPVYSPPPVYTPPVYSPPPVYTPPVYSPPPVYKPPTPVYLPPPMYKPPCPPIAIYKPPIPQLPPFPPMYKKPWPPIQFPPVYKAPWPPIPIYAHPKFGYPPPYGWPPMAPKYKHPFFPPGKAGMPKP